MFLTELPLDVLISEKASEPQRMRKGHFGHKLVNDGPDHAKTNKNIDLHFVTHGLQNFFVKNMQAIMHFFETPHYASSYCLYLEHSTVMFK